MSSREDTTGTVPKTPIASLLEPEDWRCAKAALTALDPQGNGAFVGWDNPDSGNKGSFTPMGKAYPLNSGICRVFLAKLDRKGDVHRGYRLLGKRGRLDDRRGKTLEKDLISGLAFW